MKKKAIALIAALALLLAAAVGGTLAWLSAKTDTVTNTFTVGSITVTLTETTGSTYQMVPGCEIAKDPKVYVAEGSEPCYLFVKVTAANNTYGEVSYLTYDIADGWTALAGAEGVYWRMVDKTQMGEANAFSVLQGDRVFVSSDVTEAMMTAAGGNEPTITVNAYAAQLYKNNTETFTAEEAWANVG